MIHPREPRIRNGRFDMVASRVAGHAVDYVPFIKSQLASRNWLWGLTRGNFVHAKNTIWRQRKSSSTVCMKGVELHRGDGGRDGVEGSEIEDWVSLPRWPPSLQQMGGGSVTSSTVWPFQMTTQELATARIQPFSADGYVMYMYIYISVYIYLCIYIYVYVYIYIYIYTYIYTYTSCSFSWVFHR